MPSRNRPIAAPRWPVQATGYRRGGWPSKGLIGRFLTMLLWLFGQGLQSFFAQLVKMKIDVQIYSPQSAADFLSFHKERR